MDTQVLCEHLHDQNFQGRCHPYPPFFFPHHLKCSFFRSSTHKTSNYNKTKFMKEKTKQPSKQTIGRRKKKTLKQTGTRTRTEWKSFSNSLNLKSA
jgi:hypothetical protein